MLRVIHIFGMHVPMYSVMMFLGVVAFFVVYFVTVEKKEGIDRNSSNRLLFASAIGIVVLYVSAYIFDAIFHSIEEGKLRTAGITWLGGVAGMVPFMIFFIHKIVPTAKGNAIYYLSLLIPGLVLGHAIGRLGCFCGGCCYGKVTTSIFGVSFPDGSLAAGQYPGGPDGGSLPVLPTQLFEALFELVLFTVLMVFRKKLKSYNVEIYMIAYGIFRFAMEFLRGDDRGSTGFFLTPAQFLCVLMLIAAVLMILFRKNIIFKKLNEKCRVWQQEAAKYEYPTHEKKPDSSLATLKELHAMYKEGIITRQEYDEKKKDILKRL